MIPILPTLILSGFAAFGVVHAQNTTSNVTLPVGYGPTYHTCPTNVTFLRPAEGLNPNEAAWVQGRKPVVTEALTDYLHALRLAHFDVDKYLHAIKSSANKSAVPVLSLAISGGGAPATWTGTGVIQALDARFPPAVAQRTGGLLQALTYIAGLSGGSFPVTSYAVSDFPPTADIVAQWNPFVDPFGPTGASGLQAYDTGVFGEVAEKLEAGFPIGMADYFARVESYEFIPGAGAGINTTWSGVVDLPRFKNFSMPFPILENVLVASDSPLFLGIRIPQPNSTLIEATPFEWGAWQGPRTGFTPTKYLGTELYNGQPTNTSKCVNGFDNAGFFLATASCAWNLWYVIDATNGTGPNFARRSLALDDEPHALRNAGLSKRKTIFFPQSEFTELIEAYNSSFKLTVPDILTAPYINPFLGANDSEPLLQLVDGSESGQTIPLAGVAQPARAPDLILAFDVSQETTYGWQNGTNLVDTAVWAAGFGLPFPKVASAVTMLNRGYTTRPTFFGCGAGGKSAQGELPGTPIVLYLNNAPYSSYTNFSIIDNQLDPAMVTDVLTNSFNIVTQGNGTLDSEWAECLGCAVVQRSIERLGWNTTAQCTACFAKYCWDGVDDTQLNASLTTFDPVTVLAPSLSFAQWNATHQYYYNVTE